VLLRIRNASDVSFTGFSFEHATWRRPAGPDGFVEQQSGCGPVGSDARNSQCGADEIWSQKTPGNVQVIFNPTSHPSPTRLPSPAVPLSLCR
jgi:hypothetical protein